MRPRYDLTKIKRSGLVRATRIRTQVANIVAPRLTTAGGVEDESVDRAVAFAIIELDNLWGGVARSLFLSAAFCGVDATGTRLRLSNVPRSRNTDEALTYAIRSLKGSNYKQGSTGPWTWRDEPPWWSPATLLKSLQDIGASNYQQVNTALGAYPDVFEHLHVFRNFYAHRGKDTREQLIPHLRSLQFPITYSATVALNSPNPNSSLPRSQPLVLDWLDDVQATIGLLV